MTSGTIYCKNLKSQLPSSFRKNKSTLRKDHLDNKPNLEAQKLDIPRGIKPEHWKQFCINESDEKHLELRAQNKERRKKSLYGHTGGRKSAAMIEHEMIGKKKNLVTRSDVWIANHTRKDKSILASAMPFMEKVIEKIVESKQSEGNNVNIHPLSIDVDPLTQVFGKKAKGLPGVGSSVSQRKYNDTLHAHIMYSDEKREILDKKFDKMQTRLDFVYGYCKSGKPMPDVEFTPECETFDGSSPLLDQPMPTCQANKSSAPFLTPSIAARSKMIKRVHGPSPGERDSAAWAPIESIPSLRMFELLDWHDNCVAIAEEVTDPIHKVNCHNYRLNLEREVKVSLAVKKINVAKLYKETPDAKTIHELNVGDFFVWPKSHIRFFEPKQ